MFSERLDQHKAYKLQVLKNLKKDKKGRLRYLPYTDCFCKSGKKYQFCHKKLPVSDKKITQILMRPSTKTCFVPEALKDKCHKKVINSHTVSKSNTLKEIAENGQVYQLVPKNMFEFIYSGTDFKPSLQGINKASTFNLFCKYHDSKLFSVFENQDYAFKEEQNFLLLYRSFCMEYLKKKNGLQNLHDALRQYNHSSDIIENVKYHVEMSLLKNGLEISLEDMQDFKEYLDEVLINKHFHLIKSYVITFKNNKELMFSGAGFPEYSYEGERLFDLSTDSKLENFLSFNSFFDKDGNNIVVFSWLDNHDQRPQKFVESLDRLSNSEVSNAILRLVFEYSENIYFRISWWDSLNKMIQKKLLSRFVNVLRKEKCFSDMQDEGVLNTNWEVINKFFITSRP